MPLLEPASDSRVLESLSGSAWLSCNLSTQEVGAGGLEGHGLPQLHGKLKVILCGKHTFC